MGKSLRQEHITFFTVRMSEHSLVSNWEPIPDEHEYLFKIVRTLPGAQSDVVVHLTDVYRYGLAEFFARPEQLRAGSFVVLGMPHADAAPDAIETAKKERIGIGHLGKFMGALTQKDIWEYISPDERRQKEEEQRRRQAGAQRRRVSP